LQFEPVFQQCPEHLAHFVITQIAGHPRRESARGGGGLDIVYALRRIDPGWTSGETNRLKPEGVCNRDQHFERSPGTPKPSPRQKLRKKTRGASLLVCLHGDHVEAGTRCRMCLCCQCYAQQEEAERNAIFHDVESIYLEVTGRAARKS